MALKVQAEDGVDADDVESMQFEALFALEEAMKNEEEVHPVFVDEYSYSADIVIGGIELKAENAMSLLTQLDKTAVIFDKLTLTPDAQRISSNQQKDF